MTFFLHRVCVSFSFLFINKLIFFQQSIEPAPAPEIVTIELLDSSQEDSASNSPDRPNPSDQETTEVSDDQTTTIAEDTLTKCVCAGCENPPKEDDQWEGEFCSNECAVKYCQRIFKTWVQEQKNNN